MRRLILFIVAVVACLHVTVVGSQEPAQAAPCKVLQPAELRFDAPRLTAKVTPEQDACWILPDEAGTVYQLGLDALSPLPPLFTSSDGTDACSETSALGICALVGEAPFTMTTSPLSFAPALDVTYQVFRLSGDTGCPPIATSAFGAARERTIPFAAYEATCLAFDMDDTSVPFLNLAALEEGAGLVVRTFDETGAMICEYDARCPAPESGRGTFMLAHAPNSPLTEASYRVSMWDLASTSGCAPGPGRRWDAELAVGDFSSHSEVDCWWVDSVPGDQLVTGFATRLTGIYQAFFLDESNQDPCPHNYAACQAGPQRYRFIVVNGASASQPVQLGRYGLAIRSLAPDAGCVPIRPLEFGEAPSDRHRGIGCRSFMATPGATYHLTTHDLTNTPERLLRLTEVYDAQGQPACEFQVIVESCTTDNGGRLTVVTDPAYADTLTSLYNLDSSAGCRPWTVGGLSYVVGRLSLGQVDCHLVAPSGEAPPLIQVPDTGSDYLRPTVLDAQDNVVCQHERACALSGVGSHRVLLGGRYAGNGYLVVGAESGVPRSCPELRFGGANGVLVRTTAQSPVVCVRIQGVPTERPDAIHYRRVGGSGLGALGGLPSTAVLPCYGDAPDLTYAPNGSWTCDVPTAPYSADLVLVGNGTDQAFYVSRTPGYTQESPVAGVTLLQNTQRPVITGKARPGNRLRASPGRWKPKPGAYQYVWKVAGTAVPGATGRSFKVRPAYLGKRVTVVVTAAAPNLFPASATSRGIRVTRP